MNLKDIDTPALFVDLDKMEKNIKDMHKHLNNHNIKCRPHVKTHKIPAIAHKQIKEGAQGITCQKVSEAEIMVNAGIQDILLSYNILGNKKLNSLFRLVKQSDIKVVADSNKIIEGLSQKAKEEGVSLKVLIECDIAKIRSGARTTKKVIDLAEKVVNSSGLVYDGIMQFKGGYPDNDFIRKTGSFFEEVVKTLNERGIKTNTVSSGGTVYAWTSWPEYKDKISIVNECRPGAYVFYDRIKVAEGVASLDQCAAKIVATVVSRPDKNTAILDSGSKAIGVRRGYSGSDLGSFGYIQEYPDAILDNLYEEHGVVENCPDKVRIGERLTIIPNYIMDNIHFFDTLYGIRNKKVETIWPIVARGTMQ